MFKGAENTSSVCENKFDSKPSVQQPDSGLGNELIQKRLNLIYAGKTYFGGK